MCEHCKLLVHLNCTNVNLKIEHSKIAKLWSCHAGTLRELALYHQDVLTMNKKEAVVDNYINTRHKHVKKHQHMSSQYTFNGIDFWRVSIHSQRIEIRHHHLTQNMVKERQTSFRICQFVWLQILLQEKRWKKRWWCKRIYERLYYIQN